MTSSGQTVASVVPQLVVPEPGTAVRVWQPEYAPQPVAGQLLEFGIQGPRLLMEQMVVMDRSRVLHVECSSPHLRLSIAGQHCSLRSDPQGRGWLLVCDCVPRLPEWMIAQQGQAPPCPLAEEQTTLRWEGSPRCTQEVGLLALSRQGVCFATDSAPEIGRRLAFRLPGEEHPPLIAQVQWLLQTEHGIHCVGAEFATGQRVDHLPGQEASCPPAVPEPHDLKGVSARWWPLAGIALMIAALWYLLAR